MSNASAPRTDYTPEWIKDIEAAERAARESTFACIDAVMCKASEPSDPSDVDALELMYPPNPTPWHIVSSHDPDIVAINDVEGRTVFPAVRKELAHRIIEGVNGRECASREDQP